MGITRYTGTETGRVFTVMNHVRVTLASGLGQGNGGTSAPSGGCWIQPVTGNTACVRVAVGEAASATVGIDLPFVSATVAEQPFFLPIDDVSKLYFYSSDTDAVVDILYVG